MSKRNNFWYTFSSFIPNKKISTTIIITLALSKYTLIYQTSTTTFDCKVLVSYNYCILFKKARWSDGAVYRIGELASIANVSKRTIDYYTNLGLLKANRSESNYRIYSQYALSDLKFIEECKSLHFPLDEIKRKLEIKQEQFPQEGELEKHLTSVTQQLKQLKNDLNVLLPLIERLSETQQESLSTILNTEGRELIQSLSALSS